MMTLRAALVALALLGNAAIAIAQPAGIREACKQFIERSNGAPINPDWGEYWNWTVISNSDGSYSVGAKYRYAANGVKRGAYTTCILRLRGKDFVIESLSRMM